MTHCIKHTADTSDNIGAFRVTHLTITSLWPLTKIDLISHHSQENKNVHFKGLGFVKTVKFESKIAKFMFFSVLQTNGPFWIVIIKVDVP